MNTLSRLDKNDFIEKFFWLVLWVFKLGFTQKSTSDRIEIENSTAMTNDSWKYNDVAWKFTPLYIDIGIGTTTYQKLFATLNQKNKLPASFNIIDKTQGTKVEVKIPLDYKYN